ncbi:MAG: hypothetical protein CL565_01960 [Alphaproteobacteria bacterium]|nr:hypothetical protein [Alphaproteobacteria bacterium]|tara:strand:+ start:862 stop:1509 length:648 start_codon:yes stop_codon:yes gene_type:complete
MSRLISVKSTFFGLIILSLTSFGVLAQDSNVSMDNEAVGDPSASPTIAFSSQNTEELPPELIILQLVDSELQNIYKRDSFVPPNFPSLFFLPGEHRALKTALASFVARPPTEEEIANSENGGIGQEDDLGEGTQKTYPREVKLGGILYNGNQDWIIWINQTRITPDAIPSEILDINVYENYVELKWFDGGTNKIYPVRLRPNQRFNIDARMFLPG